MTAMLLVVGWIAVQLVLIYMQLQKSNELAEQAITQRLAIAEWLQKIAEAEK
jgi:hypothetical protein